MVVVGWVGVIVLPDVISLIPSIMLDISLEYHIGGISESSIDSPFGKEKNNNKKQVTFKRQ